MTARFSTAGGDPSARPGAGCPGAFGLPVLPVCVVIPAYNRAGELDRCLASVWSQRPALPAEVLVVDDQSTDETSAVAERLGAQVIRHEENRGAAAARNTALEATGCEWVAFLDSDDEWLPHHLDQLWKLRGEHALVGGSVVYRREGSADHRFHGALTRAPLVLDSPDLLISSFNVFTASASMIRRDVALAIGGFHRWWGVEDFDLWVRLLERYTAICSPRVTVVYHIHDQQLSLERERMQEGHRGVAVAHIERTGRSRAALERWEAAAAWDMVRGALAEGNLSAAIRHAPGMFWGRQRIAGLLGLWFNRFRLRRRTSCIDRSGEDSIAVLIRDEALRRDVVKMLATRSVRDFSTTASPVVLLALLRRPAGRWVVGSRLAAIVLRAIGARAVTATELGDHSFDTTGER